MSFPYTDQQLSQLFGKFAGRAVNAREETHKLQLKNLGDFDITEVHIDPQDPAVAELAAAAQAAGLELRLWTPGSVGTMDFVVTRLNAGVEKAADGTFRITNNFSLG